MRKVIASGMIANSLEWYDYALYGLLAPVISQLFFPSDDHFISLIATFGVFAAGFLMRPLGAVLFGYVGDEYGRKVALVASILLMAVPTACIGLLPTYGEIGVFAPILLTLLRLLQGLSLGGAFSGSMVFIVEHAPPSRRGIAGATTMFSMVLGVLMGAAVAGLVSSLVTAEQFTTWGWRVPFLLGAGAGFAALYIRRHIEESPHYLQAKARGGLSPYPFRELFSDYKARLLQVVGITLLLTVPFYILTVFMLTLMEMLHYSKSDALLMNTLSMGVMLVAILGAAVISDRIGRRPVLMVGALLFFVAAAPLFWLICTRGFAGALAGQMAFGLLLGGYIGALPAALVEAFPTRVRYTGMSLSYNICITLFGATSPLFSTALVRFITNRPDLQLWLGTMLGSFYVVIAFYIMLASVLAFIALFFYKDVHDRSL